MNLKPLPAEIIYGADYNPEQWPRETWLEDVRLMQQAGVNMVSLAIFSWAHLEPRAGHYRFEWLDEVMDLLHGHGISVNLATAVASPPPWLIKLYPDLRPVTSSGVRLEVGSRQTYCPSHLGFRSHARQLVSRIAQRYSAHPALRLWHLNNEYACHIGECYCDTCAQKFRTWLEARYGSIEELNRVWGTAFWSQRYDDWGEIQPPREAPTFRNPTQQLDWRRFSSDNLLELMQMEIEAVRQHSPDVPVVTNFMGFHKPLDYFKWAKHEDIVADDRYPDPFDPNAHLEAAMCFDLMRSLRQGQRWILMEQAPSAVNWRPHNALKRPGLMRLFSQQAVAHGAQGIMFFQWRASKAGAEKFHSGMVQHVGAERSRVFREICDLGAELKQLAFLDGAKVKAKVALLMDWESWWALELDAKPSSSVQQLEQLRKYYFALRGLGLNLDFVHPEGDLSGYSLVIAPNLYLCSEKAAANLEAFVEQGGTFVMGFFSGIVDPNEHIYLGGYPAPFRRMLGMWVEEWATLEPGDSRTLRLWDGTQAEGRLWCDLIHLEGAKAMGEFTQDFFTGSPALTQHGFGKGQAYYVGTDLTPEVLKKLFTHVCTQAGLDHSSVPSTLDVTVAQTTQGDVLHLLNFGLDGVEVRIPAGGTDVFSGKAVGDRVQLGGLELRLIRFGHEFKVSEISVLESPQ